MALIARLDRVESWLERSEALQEVCAYLGRVMQEGSEERARILGMELHAPRRIALGGGAFAIEQGYLTKPYAEAFFESHETYVDFQLVLSGREIFAVGEKGDFTLKESYDEERDLIVYETPAQESCSRFLLEAGSLAVFLPYDVHAGSLQVVQGESIEVRKSVVKVPLAWVEAIL